MSSRSLDDFIRLELQCVFIFIHKLWMNQASRGNPFSITRTRRCFFGNCTSTMHAFRLSICCAIAHAMCSSRSGCSPLRLSSAVKIVSSQGALPNATAILRSQRR
ncbi:hypothetical protein b4670 [Escherichia coli K-12]|nr:hypothetical protein b4670 [Escherichia coli K-12]